jgi:hypothetical protein
LLFAESLRRYTTTFQASFIKMEIFMSHRNYQLPEELSKELALIPAHKLSELYSIIHYFRMGIEYEAQQINQKHPISSRKPGQLKGAYELSDSFFDPLPEEELRAWES